MIMGLAILIGVVCYAIFIAIIWFITAFINIGNKGRK